MSSCHHVIMSSLSLFRSYVCMELKKAVEAGRYEACVFVNNERGYSNFNEWHRLMRKNYEFVDHYFLEAAAMFLNQDIVVIPLHARPPRLCHVIKGKY